MFIPGRRYRFAAYFSRRQLKNLLAALASARHETAWRSLGVAWFWPLAFYIIGSVPTGFLMARARGIDIRQHGSGNIGATNVGRVMGRNWGFVAFACDFLKGFLPLFLLRWLVYPSDADWPVALLLVVCGLAGILGHNFTPWLGFKGGKGVATTGGVVAALIPWAFLIVLGVWIVLTALTRTVSIGSILAAVALPITTARFSIQGVGFILDWLCWQARW